MNDSSGSLAHAKTSTEETSSDSCYHQSLWAAAGVEALLGGGSRAVLTIQCHSLLLSKIFPGLGCTFQAQPVA